MKLVNVIKFSEIVDHLNRGTSQWLHAAVRSALEINNRIRAFDAELPKLVRHLLDRSWALPIDTTLPLVLSLAEMRELGDAEGVEKALGGFFSEKLTQIEQTLVAQFPARAVILRDAFWAHREGKFTLSIPTMLAQIDGIWHDLAQQNFYRPRGRKAVEALLVREANGAREAIVLILTDVGAIRRDSKETRSSLETLSRHLILHGVSIDYPSELNSLKCASWLSLLVSIAQERTGAQQTQSRD